MNFNNLFSGGLGKGGRMASWAVGIGMAGVWWYMDNKDKLHEKRKFSKDDMEKWNEKKKKEIKEKSEKQ